MNSTLIDNDIIICEKLESLGYIFAANSMGLSSFKFSQLYF